MSLPEDDVISRATTFVLSLLYSLSLGDCACIARQWYPFHWNETTCPALNTNRVHFDMDFFRSQPNLEELKGDSTCNKIVQHQYLRTITSHQII